MLDPEVFVWGSFRSSKPSSGGIGEDHTLKFVSVDGFTTRSIPPGKITTLEHELGNHTMEDRSRVSVAVLAGTELAEVACRHGHDVVIQLEDDPTSWSATNSDIEL